MILPALVLMAVRIQPDAPAVEYRQPQLAAGNGMVAMTYGAGKSIYFAASKDNGRTFAPAVTVASEGVLALGRHRGPRVTILPQSIVITAVAGKSAAEGAHAHGLPADGDLRVWRSTDKGKTWTAAGIITDVPGAAREGLHAIAADRKGNLFAAWLDLRAKGTRLYGSRSLDGGLTWSKNVLVYESPDGTICQCCHPSIAFDRQGRISVMWRNVLQGSRDLYFSTSEDGQTFAKAQRMGNGTWQLNACPMDGGALAVDDAGLVSVWRRDGEIFLARPGQPETVLGKGKDVALAVGKKGLYTAWSGPDGIQVRLPGANASVPLHREGAFVNLLALPNGSVLAAWEHQGSLTVEPLP
ncbi:MAG: sialidase family protein [Bryobacteraceae bacterium]